MLRIAQMIDSVIVGGAEKLQVTFAEEILQRDDIRLTIICLRDMEPSFREELLAMGVHLIFFEGKKLYNLARFRRLLQFVRREKFDLIHAHLSASSLLAPILGALSNTPVVTTIHNVKDSREDVGKLRDSLENWMLKHGTKELIAVGHVVAEANQKRLQGRPMHVIHNAVPQMPTFSTEEDRETRQAIIGDANQPFILSVGRLLTQKGYCDLLDAFAEVNKAHPDTRLAIAGQGPLHDKLQGQIDHLGLSDVAQLLGVRRDVARLLSACDFFVSSSWWEGHPIAVLEAMAAGTPVIATAVGEIPVMVVEGTGVLVPPRQAPQLADAMLAMLADERKRDIYGQAAREHIMTHYSAEAWVNKLVNFYQTMLSA